MTCLRIEDEDLLTEAGEELERHLAQCPDCRAGMDSYERIASWIAKGKTAHRAPPDWERRTLDRLLATSSSPSSAPASAERADAMVPAAELSRATLAEAAGTRMRPASIRSRYWSRATIPLTAALIATVVFAAIVASERGRVGSRRVTGDAPRAATSSDRSSQRTPATQHDDTSGQPPASTGVQDPPSLRIGRREGATSEPFRGQDLEIAPDPRGGTNASGNRGTGALMVSVEPSALVYLDGVPLGWTPLMIKPVRAGTHLLRLKNHNSEKNMAIRIGAGQTTRITTWTGREPVRDDPDVLPMAN